ncbi:MAG TPA: LON peptidase substrate-binding domain-containing protein [Rhizomicrobium sp.]|nr:LON peptidase substrate-binding domain-containing protein [Rhizomicrobium sp.]
MSGRYRHLDDLPDTLPVFPLSGVLLLPRGQLPLNVFEPRYLAMVDAALKGERMIGMIQPTEPEEKTLKPALSAVGCAGRLSAYRETDDGRYLITLTGICRYRVAEELASETPYRQVRADFAPYAADLAQSEDMDFPRERLIGALRAYLSRRDLKADWQSVMNAPAETLVNALAMLCPFEPAEKQALLEARDWAERVAILVALLEMASAATGGPASVN